RLPRLPLRRRPLLCDPRRGRRRSRRRGDPRRLRAGDDGPRARRADPPPRGPRRPRDRAPAGAARRGRAQLRHRREGAPDPRVRTYGDARERNGEDDRLVLGAPLTVARPGCVKLLSVIHYPVFGGPHNRNIRIAPLLRAAGIEPTVLLPDEPGDAEE